MKLLRAFALIVAGLCLIWAGWLFLGGGFDAQILGLKFTTHDPRKLLYVTAAALLIFRVAGGRFALPTPLMTWAASLDHRWVVAVLAAVIFVVGLAFGTMVGGGSDSYGYVSQAEMLRSGRLTLPQPWVEAAPWPSKWWTFAPLGYRPMDTAGPAEIAPSYPVGLPLLMVIAHTVAGYRAMFAVGPLCGAVLVLATFGIGRRLGASGAGVIAAWLVATSPVFLFMLVAPMSDVPAAACWASAAYFMLGAGLPSALAAGVLSAVAILLRPNVVFLAGVFGFWYVIHAWRASGATRRQWIARAAAFAAPAILASLAIGALNARYRGGMLTSGYDLHEMFEPWHIAPNFKNYLSWFVDTQTPIALAGFAALFVPLKWLWPNVRDRLVFVIVGLFVVVLWLEYVDYLVFDVWWYLRFLLPNWPFIMLGLGTIAVAGFQSRRPWLVLSTAVVIVFLGARGVWIAGDRYAFQLWKGDHKYVTVAQAARDLTGEHDVILSMQHSGTLRYYGGRLSARFDQINEDWLDRAVVWLAAQGAHPYALLEDWEVPMFRQRFAGQRTVLQLDRAPVFVYEGPATIKFYDLLRPEDATPPTRLIVEDYRGPRCVPPAPPPRVAWAQ